MSSISSLHVNPDQPNPRSDPNPDPNSNPNPSPNPNLTLTLTRTWPWGDRGRQGQARDSAACFGGVFPKKRRAAAKPALTNKTRILHTQQCFVQDAAAHRSNQNCRGLVWDSGEARRATPLWFQYYETMCTGIIYYGQTNPNNPNL